ncbi:hypothetical protein BATDEDRAFT_90391 [Batrachochytrium dendrobatidis JAM81]|uniref:Uncharacterized protein n=2 Tax=Batrachochytrium dendrobatidis TaxID=109871 RepID=F4P7N9_BATDJ|nr:uncharacterized protein BATDEDRAFT_90391 [Batrachochytrium dendrobatidis JAM81]XP_006683429.1 uncharacterized protein BATDEDRAFT_93192 [Batrachochytrium dendrobatidis JAM81]EGF75945.1 hypothetical protein BATDEDRAFT_93192 [Batrachochytrium dendrobatidis JAM81]EGF78637.1 hypothetical protein BATDEDRAFT_90391 [Batrachochytrium dendrobatidis JAM81]|eukprot:XP_006680921.1 hypothetical protein BATDEDRAFT_90391 [Batrachochytrium dendrobatidis JAM81]
MLSAQDTVVPFDLPIKQQSMDTTCLYGHLPSDDEEDDEFLPVEGHHTDTVDEDNGDLDEDDPEEHHADIPVQEITDLVMTAIPMQPSLLRKGKSINNTIQDSILAQTFESEDDADDDYDCGTEGAEDEMDNDVDMNDIDTDPLTVQEAQDNIAHFELATSCATDMLYNPAKVLRDGKEILLPGDMDCLSSKIDTLMQIPAPAEESTVEA